MDRTGHIAFAKSSNFCLGNNLRPAFLWSDAATLRQVKSAKTIQLGESTGYEAPVGLKLPSDTFTSNEVSTFESWFAAKRN
jgi:hypothetical protein